MGYSTGCDRRPESLGLPWGTIIGGAVDIGRAVIGGGGKVSIEDYYPPAMQGRAVIPGPFDVDTLEIQLNRNPGEVAALREVLEAADGRWRGEYRPLTMRQLAAAAINEAHGGRDATPNDAPSGRVAAVVERLVLKPLDLGPSSSGGSIALPTTRPPVPEFEWAGPPVVDYAGPYPQPAPAPSTPAPRPPAPAPAPELPATSGGDDNNMSMGVMTDILGSTRDFFKDTLADLAESTRATLEAQAKQAEAAVRAQVEAAGRDAAGRAWDYVPEQYRGPIVQSAAQDTLSRNLPMILAAGAGLLFLATRK